MVILSSIRVIVRGFLCIVRGFLRHLSKKFYVHVLAQCAVLTITLDDTSTTPIMTLSHKYRHLYNTNNYLGTSSMNSKLTG